MRPWLVAGVLFLQGCCCCPCPGGGDWSMPDDLEELAAEKGAELVLEKAMGPGTDVELDTENRRWTIKRPEGRMEVWGDPDGLPAASKAPVPPGVDLQSVVVLESLDDKSRADQVIFEFAPSERDRVQKFYEDWAKEQGLEGKMLSGQEIEASLSQVREQMQGVELGSDLNMDLPEVEDFEDEAQLSWYAADKRGAQIVVSEDGAVVTYFEGTNDPGDVSPFDL